jgi:hypothetical protein
MVVSRWIQNRRAKGVKGPGLLVFENESEENLVNRKKSKKKGKKKREKKIKGKKMKGRKMGKKKEILMEEKLLNGKNGKKRKKKMRMKDFGKFDKQLLVNVRSRSRIKM